jgi:hypothetical protein
MERRATKSKNRNVAIAGENSQRSIIPVRSNLSRFSRGTIRNPEVSLEISLERAIEKIPVAKPFLIKGDPA